MNATRGVQMAMLAVVGAQAGYLLVSHVVPDIRRLTELRALEPMDRSAVLFAGETFADFMAFLRAQLPDHATLIIPRFEQDALYGHEGIMQYFLIPTRVANCHFGADVLRCIEDLRGPTIFVLGVGNFPPREAAERGRLWVPFDEARGVFIPAP